MTKTSATKRLLDFLQRTEDSANNEHIRAVLVRAFQLLDRDHVALSAAYTDLLRLVEEAAEEVKHHYGDRASVPLRPINRIGRALQQNSVNHPWGQVSEAFKGARGELEQVEVAVTEASRESAVSEDSLSSIREKLKDVADLLDQEGMDPTLVALIRKHLEEIRRATLLYQLEGIGGLRSSLEAALGAVQTRPRPSAPRGVSRAVWVAYLAVLGDVSQIVSTAVTTRDFRFPRALREAAALPQRSAPLLLAAPVDVTAVAAGRNED